ncbi:hypothetical protein QE152_g8076 [Popillia japonica]|uniref:Uncharacterized protein n=1 Tax=Popillia japonica TaxID=7064 RepID=A0AAW1MC82_POPJA
MNGISTSHKLQPLDLTVFGPLKTYYNQSLDEWHINNPGKTFDIYSTAEILGKIYTRAISTTYILPLKFWEKFIPEQLARAISYVTDRTAVNDKIPANDAFAVPSTSNDSYENRVLPPTPNIQHLTARIISPEEVVPYPKAASRKRSNRGRKTAATCILTDTPEREAITRKKEESRNKQLHKNLKFPNSKKKVTRQLISSKSEDDDLQKQTDIMHSDENECDMEENDAFLANLEENKECDMEENDAFLANLEENKEVDISSWEPCFSKMQWKENSSLLCCANYRK